MNFKVTNISYSWIINFCDAFFELPTLVEKDRWLSIKTEKEYDYATKLGEKPPSHVRKLKEGYPGTDGTFWNLMEDVEITVTNFWGPNLAMLVIHELTHIPWIGATNKYVEKVVDDKKVYKKGPEEVYGWFEAAEYAHKQTAFNAESYTKNADNYAWYAECE